MSLIVTAKVDLHTLRFTLNLGKWADELDPSTRLALRGIPQQEAWQKLLDLVHDEIESEAMFAFASTWDGDYRIDSVEEARAIAELVKLKVFGPLSAIEAAAAALGVQLPAPPEQPDLFTHDGDDGGAA